MERFTASVQYGEWQGTTAADNADQQTLTDYLRNKSLINQDEFPVGVKAYIGENHNGNVKPPFIRVFIAPTKDNDSASAFISATSNPIPLRELEITLTLDEFLGLFKRFSITISRCGLDGREYESHE